MPIMRKNAGTSPIDRQLWAYWTSWVRWLVLPVPLFLYLSFLLHLEIMPETADPLALATKFLIANLILGFAFFCLGFLLAWFDRLSLQPLLGQRNFWGLEAQAWAEHQAQVAARTHRQQRLSRLGRSLLWLWAIGGGIAALYWPSFLLGAEVASGLLLGLAIYIQAFWRGPRSTGWFAPQPLFTFFFSFALILQAFLSHSRPYDQLFEANEHVSTMLDPFALGDSALSNWFFSALLCAWLMTQVYLPNLLGPRASARNPEKRVMSQ